MAQTRYPTIRGVHISAADVRNWKHALRLQLRVCLCVWFQLETKREKATVAFCTIKYVLLSFDGTDRSELSYHGSPINRATHLPRYIGNSEANAWHD